MQKIIEEINREISVLENELSQVKGTKTEVYTRIVGYHRAVSNWNKGKREEYNHRICFDVEKGLTNEIVNKHSSAIKLKDSESVSYAMNGAAVKYVFFYGEYCRNCQPVKDYLAEAQLNGDHIDVGSELGLNVARQYNVTSTPTVLMLDENGFVSAKLHSVNEVENFLNPAQTATA